MNGISIRRITREDAAALAAIERECFSDPWSEESLKYEAENPSACFVCAEEEKRIAGYIGMHYVLDEGYIANVAVTAAYRRRGVASGLIREILTEAEKLSLSFVSLEVRVSNAAAIALYTKFGFESLGLRKGYYEHPKEDAVIMTYYLKKEV